MFFVDVLILFWLVPSLVVALLLIWCNSEPLAKWDIIDVVFWLIFSILYPLGIFLLYRAYRKDLSRFLWKTLTKPLLPIKKENT